MKSPILVYPDQNKPCTLFMDASKYALSAALTQQCINVVNGKTLSH